VIHDGMQCDPIHIQGQGHTGLIYVDNIVAETLTDFISAQIWNFQAGSLLQSTLQTHQYTVVGHHGPVHIILRTALYRKKPVCHMSLYRICH